MTASVLYYLPEIVCVGLVFLIGYFVGVGKTHKEYAK